MKYLLLNCDQVFDVLTRGPFPTGDASDESVEHHLRACHDCRQLAEALRPAVALLHEAVERDQATDLPEYQGTLPQRQAALPSNGRRAIRRQKPVFDRAVGVVRLIAASLLLAALGALAYGFAVSPSTTDRLAGFSGLLAPPHQATHLPDGPGLLRLASLQLPARCLPASYQTLTAEQAAALATKMAAGSEEALRCCTECHSASHARPARANLVAAAADSCLACHRG